MIYLFTNSLYVFSAAWLDLCSSLYYAHDISCHGHICEPRPQDKNICINIMTTDKHGRHRYMTEILLN
jgi:hypothetical protein